MRGLGAEKESVGLGPRSGVARHKAPRDGHGRGFMRHAIRTLIVFTALLSAATAAPAEIVKGVWEVGALGGWGSGDDDVESGGTYGIKAGYSLTSILEIEFAAELFGAEQKITGSVGPANEPAQQVDLRGEGIFADTSFYYYALGLTANFRTETEGAKLIPYISVALGQTVQYIEEYSSCVPIRERRLGLPSTDPTNPGRIITCDDFDDKGVLLDPNASFTPEHFAFPSDVERKDTGALVTAGLGLRYFVTPRIGGRLEVRYYHHDSFDLNQDAFAIQFGVTVALGYRQ